MNKKKCFVILPFSETTSTHSEEYWNIFYKIIKSILKENNYECSRSEVGPYNLTTNIIKNINDSDLVIAVLTDLNANVWYELGIRHALKNGTIMLMQEGHKVPFDINSCGIIFYKDTIGLKEELESEIGKYIEKLNTQSCDSPVQSVLGHRIDKAYESKLEEFMQRILNRMPKENTNEEESKRYELLLLLNANALVDKLFEILDKNKWQIDKKNDVKHQILSYIEEMKIEEFEKKCMDLIDSIIFENRDYTRTDAIECVKMRLEIAKRDENIDEQLCAKYRRVIKEFEIATDEEFKALHDIIWE